MTYCSVRWRCAGRQRGQEALVLTPYTMGWLCLSCLYLCLSFRLDGPPAHRPCCVHTVPSGRGVRSSAAPVRETPPDIYNYTENNNRETIKIFEAHGNYFCLPPDSSLFFIGIILAALLQQCVGVTHFLAFLWTRQLKTRGDIKQQQKQHKTTTGWDVWRQRPK